MADPDTEAEHPDAEADHTDIKGDHTDTDENVDAEDHERFTRRAIELARAAAEHGNEPYGALLVHDGRVIAESENTVVTDGDVGAHPELKLARSAIRNLDVERRRETTLYASTEPCSMCVGAIRAAELGRVVFSVPGDRANELAAGGEVVVPAVSTILTDGVETVGSVLRDAGELVHEECWGPIR